MACDASASICWGIESLELLAVHLLQTAHGKALKEEELELRRTDTELRLENSHLKTQLHEVVQQMVHRKDIHMDFRKPFWLTLLVAAVMAGIWVTIYFFHLVAFFAHQNSIRNANRRRASWEVKETVPNFEQCRQEMRERFAFGLRRVTVTRIMLLVLLATASGSYFASRGYFKPLEEKIVPYLYLVLVAVLVGQAVIREVWNRATTLFGPMVETMYKFHSGIQVFASGNATVFLLRFICCTWVFSQVYLQEFRSVRALLRYHDFSRWFLPLKGEEVRNSWTICIPIIQYMVLQCITIVSFLVICAFDEPFDIVMNSLAFTFIAEVGSVFNDPLVHRMANTCIKDLPEGYPVIKYLYPEYQLSNAVNDDGTYTDGGWYICEEEEKAGLLSDYRVRHNEAAYPQQHQRAKFLEILIFALPAFCIFLGAWHSHCREEPNAKECHLERLRFLRLDL